MRSPSGQAAADYAALLLVVLLVLAVGGAVVAVPGVGERVVALVRVGICVVGGDVCRDSDAQALGLQPCTVRSSDQGSDTAVELMSLRVGEDGRWSVSVQSDGGAVVSREDGKALGGTTGVGISVGPLDIGVDATSELRGRSARSWRFESVPAAERFVRQAQEDPGVIDRVPPDERWSSFGSRAGVSGEVSVPVFERPLEKGRRGVEVAVDDELAEAEAGLANALGRRTGGGRTTLFFRMELEAAKAYAGLPAWSTSTPSREALVELTRDAGGLRELVVRTARDGGGRREETVARLDLRDALIRERLGSGAAPPPSTLHELARLAATHGVVERQVYAIDDRSDSDSLSAKIGIAFGFEHTDVDVRRRLTDAAVWIAGSGPRRREDCLTLVAGGMS